MKETNGEDRKTTKHKEEVITYLEKLKYALDNDNTIITIQEERQVDRIRPIEYTNKYTLAQLFPDESPREAMLRELKTLKVSEYMHTVRDTRYRNLSSFWAFGRQYNKKDVYIKIRVEIVPRNSVLVMSFHFSDRELVSSDFPYLIKRGSEN